MKIIDKEILKNFVITIIFSLMALYVIFLIVNMVENLDDFLAANMSTELIVKYYILFFPELVKLLLPIAVLLSTLFTVGKMSNSNEITALKSGGVSIIRLMIPIFLFSLLICVGSIYFNGWIVPKVNKDKLSIEQNYLKKNLSSTSVFNLYFRESQKNILSMQTYNATEGKGYNISYEKFADLVKPRLLSRIESDNMKWDSAQKNWIMYNGVNRQILINDNVLIQKFDSLRLNIAFDNDKLKKLSLNPKEMNLTEFKDYIETLQISGKDVRKELTDYYGQWAYPFASVIVILFAFPFATVKKKGGTAVQVAAALVVTFAYLIFTKVGQIIGYNSNFNPIIAGWFANIVFLVFGFIVLFRTKS